MLTLERLKKFGDNEIIRHGGINDSPDGINMSNSGDQLKWVAVAGNGYHDWTIYCHWAERDIEWVVRHGDKVTREEHIKRLVPCDDEALKMYRK